MKKILASLTLSVILAVPAVCETSVWIAKTDSSVLYIGGTIHLLRESDRPFPPEYDSAYKASEKLVFETDLAALSSPEFQQMILAKAIYSDGRTLDKVLSAEAYGRLGKLCAEYGLPLESMNQMKPSILMVTLLGLELQKLGVDQEGIDLFYYGKAAADSKPIEGLETVEEQVEMLTSMGDGIENAFVVHSMDEMTELDELFDKMIAAWRAGDETSLLELFIKEMKGQFPKLFKAVLVDRNMNWIPKLQEYIVSPETELVLVGVAHLVGEEGVIAQLEKLGYEVEKLK